MASSARRVASPGLERSACSTSARKTVAPSASSASAMPRPMPRAAPVTSALSPSSSFDGIGLEEGGARAAAHEEQIGGGNHEQGEERAEQQPADDHPADRLARFSPGAHG